MSTLKSILMVRILLIDGRPRNQGKEKITTKDINDYEPATSFDSSASVIWRRRLLLGGPAYGGGGAGLVLLIIIIVLLAGGFRRR